MKAPLHYIRLLQKSISEMDDLPEYAYEQVTSLLIPTPNKSSYKSDEAFSSLYITYTLVCGISKVSDIVASKLKQVREELRDDLIQHINDLNQFGWDHSEYLHKKEE